MSTLKKYTQRIEFWIFILFVIRLVGVFNPPLEIGHSWRQVTGLMVARNFLEVDASILFPRVDDNMGGAGIIGMEFPSLNYLYYWMASIFGYEHWYGRLINLIVSSFGLLFFYKIIRISAISERIAFFATLLLGASIWFTFSRKMMPDTYCISLMFIGIYYAIVYLQQSKISALLLYILFSSLAILSKIPAGIYLIVLLPFILNKKILLKNKITTVLMTIPALSLTYWWYFIWNPMLSEKYGIWYNAGMPFLEGMKEIFNNLAPTLHNFTFNAFSGYILFVIFVAGLVLAFVKKERKIFVPFLLVLGVFIPYVFKSGFFFHHHNYYIIPFVPAMALVAAYALNHIQKKWIFFSILLLGITESIANQQHDLFIKKSEKYKMSLEPILQEFSSKEDLIVINGNDNPQLIYLTHRKGWNCSDEQITDTAYLSGLKAEGCKYIVVHKPPIENEDWNNLTQIKLYEDEYFIVLKND